MMKTTFKIKKIAESPRTFKAFKAWKEEWQEIKGVTNTVFANNGTTKVKALQKNKIASISCNKKQLVADEMITYTVKLDEKEKAKVKAEIKRVKFCLWFQYKDDAGKIRKVEIDKKITPAGVILVRKRDAAPRVTNIFEPRADKAETLTGNLDNAYYYANISYTDKEAILKIKYSKWMDGCRIRVEAYFNKILQDGGKTTASRWLQAKPEILDAYWMNAEGQKVHSAGYEQDLYLYLKTLGLRGKEIEVQVHEKDYYHSPAHAMAFAYGKKGDELIEWKNNNIKIKKSEAIKQFKVGNKRRYEQARKNEKDDDYCKWYNDQIKSGQYFVGLDFSYKYGTDLELYIHFPEQANLKLDKNNQFADLILTEKAQILDAYFATAEKQEVQADTPATKKNPNPTTKVTHYNKIDKGVLGQTVYLVAECPNLEGVTIAFEVYEKKYVLDSKPTSIYEGALPIPLPLVYDGKDEQRYIETQVKDGFAVAEVGLKHKKKDSDNEDWEKLLDPDTGKLKTTALYLKVVPVKNSLNINDNTAFLVDEPFELNGTTVVQDIYHDGHIGKVEYEQNNVKMKKVKFIYHDSSKKKHDLGKVDIIWAQKWLKGSRHYIKGTKKVTVGSITRYYTYGKGDTPLVTPFSGTSTNKRYSFVKAGLKIIINENTTREYFNPERLAAVFGALAETGFEDVVCNGSVASDGTGAPSVTHVNGNNIDFKYLRTDKKRANIDLKTLPILVNDKRLDITRQNNFLDVLYKFGFGRTKKNLAHKTHKKKDLNHCKSQSAHKDHLHIQGFKANYKL